MKRVLNDITIHADVHSGVALYQACEACRNLRKKHGLDVVFEFNGCQFRYSGQQAPELKRMGVEVKG